MDIRITENLKSFRKKNGNTQEELANHLNISVQAVSKWERGEGYPDITLLPLIAAYYNKSVDELLGCDEIQKAQKINEYLCQYDKNGNCGKIQDNIELMKKALKEFPNDLTLMFKLCNALLFVDKAEYLDECIRVGEKILTSCVDDSIRFPTIQHLVYAYNSKNEREKAKEYAEKLPDLHCSRNTVLECVVKGEQLRKLTQGNIAQHVALIDSSVTWMLRSKDYTAEERIFAYETVDKLYNLFLYDGNYGTEHCALHMLWMNISGEYARLKDASNTISALKKAYYHAYEMDNFKEGKYSSLFADTGEYSKKSFLKNFEKSYVEWLKSVMQESVFDFIRDTEEWNSIMN